MKWDLITGGHKANHIKARKHFSAFYEFVLVSLVYPERLQTATIKSPNSFNVSMLASLGTEERDDRRRYREYKTSYIIIFSLRLKGPRNQPSTFIPQCLLKTMLLRDVTGAYRGDVKLVINPISMWTSRSVLQSSAQTANCRGR